MAELDDELLDGEETIGVSGDAVGIYEPEPDEDDEYEEQHERTTIATALPLMEELLEWFDEQIKGCDSIEQLIKTQKLTGLDLEASLHAHDIVRDLLESRRDNLKARVDEFLSRREED